MASTETRIPQTPPRSRARPRTFRLRGRTHKLALTAHVLSSVGWFGIAVLVAFCAITATSAGDPDYAHSLYQVVETSPWLSVPVGLVAVATGVLLSLGTNYGLVRQWWVVIKIVIAVAVIVTDPLVIASAARDAVASGGSDSIIQPTIAHCVMLAIATILSVFKPFGRTPWGKKVLARTKARVGT
jgi:hypothetical protein